LSLLALAVLAIAGKAARVGSRKKSSSALSAIAEHPPPTPRRSSRRREVGGFGGTTRCKDLAGNGKVAQFTKKVTQGFDAVGANASFLNGWPALRQQVSDGANPSGHDGGNRACVVPEPQQQVRVSRLVVDLAGRFG
jgi:hypothetical protein